MRDCPLRIPLSAKSITERLMGMNYQRSTNKRFALRSIVVCMLVLVALVACVAVSVYADGAAVTAENIEIGADNVVVIDGVRYYTKVYDGTTDVDGRLTLAAGFDTSILGIIRTLRSQSTRRSSPRRMQEMHPWLSALSWRVTR